MRTLTLLLLALVFVAGATTVTFQPDATVGKDAHCYSWSSYPLDGSGGYGSTSLLKSGWYSSHFDHRFDVSYVEFTELDDSQYQGATVVSATLWLYIDWSPGGVNNLGAANSEWDEDGINWNNRPGARPGIIDYCPGSDRWAQVDVTSYVQNWLDGTWENYGFLLGSFGGQETRYVSSDHSDSSKHPKLVLEYYGVAVEETTWGEIKATF
ncbi:DNRLRE domain-containing protein [bacterium]|nr:DNRLRE domain-containing protein [bacterium]